MKFVKPVFILLISVGILLLGKGFWDIFQAVYFFGAADSESVEGTVVGYFSKTSRHTDSSGRIKVSRWFPQPMIKVKTPTGSIKFTDPGLQLWQYWKKGSKVPVRIRPTTGGSYVGRTTSFFTMFLFPLFYCFFAAMFIVLPLLVWPALEQSDDSLNRFFETPTFSQFPMPPKYMLFAMFALFGLAAILAFKDHIIQMLPSSEGELLVTKIETLKIDEAKKMIEAGVPLHHSNRYTGKNAFMAALQTKDNKLIKLIMDNDPPIYTIDKVGRNALYYAVKNSQYEAAKWLLDKGAKPYSNFDDLLTMAITLRNPAMAKLLISSGAEVNYRHPRYKYFPIDWAILAKEPRLVVLLHEKGAKYTAPQEFIDVALNKEVLGPRELRFRKMKLNDWIKICKSQAASD